VIYGRIKSLKFGKEKILTPVMRGGYCRVVLHKNNTPKNFQIHRLVANAFIPNTENKPDVNHINRNKS
jgi:hypothetical protein